MEGRKLELIEAKGAGMAKAVFNSNGRRISRNITQKEFIKAAEILKAGDEYKIDSFCYSIA